MRTRGLSWPSTGRRTARHILFAGLRDGIWNVYRTGRGRRAGDAPHGQHDGAHVRPLSRLVAAGRPDRYEQTETTGNVWLVEPPP